MAHPLDRKIILYSSLFLAAVINLPRLLLLQSDDLLSNLIPFNWYDWIIRLVMVFLYSLTTFYFNKKHFNQSNGKWGFEKQTRVLLINILILLIFVLVSSLISRHFVHSKLFFLNGNLMRLTFAGALVFIELKIISAVYTATKKEKENEQLRHANTTMELELLKAQLNPHFLFNALSSLSGAVYEDPNKAQQYIIHLSKIFRYSLNGSRRSLTTLKEELDEIHSYSELMKMRHEGGFNLDVNVSAEYLAMQLPHISLQPLVENALKHNMATTSSPLKISITAKDSMLTISNNLQPKPFPEKGSGIGLGNLNERFKILLKNEIEVVCTNDTFAIILPLI